MATTSSLRALSVPVVSSDSGLWGSELNNTIGYVDAIFGATTIIQSSAGLSQTLTTSMAQTQRINVQGSPTGQMTLTFPSSLGASGVYSVWNTTASSLAFGVLCQTTGAGSNCTVPNNSQRLVQVDGTNAYFADQVALPSFNIPPVLSNYLTGFQVSNSSNTGLTIGAGLAADQSGAAYLLFGGMTKSAGSLWAAGSGNGGMGNGLGFSPGTTYHIFEISNSTNPNSSNIASSSIDIYFDTSITAANSPANTNFYRRVFSLNTHSSAAIWFNVSQYGDEVLLVPSFAEKTNANVPGAPALVTLASLPTGVKFWVHLRGQISNATNSVGFLVQSPDETLITPTVTNSVAVATPQGNGFDLFVRSNTAAQVAWSAGSGTVAGLACIGWRDRRGQDGSP